jgi:CO dehydrogenase maturation factor
VSVYRQWTEYAADYDVALAVIGNKVHGSGDVAFLREHVGDALLACVGDSHAVRAMEQGRPFALDDLAETDQRVLAAMRQAVDARVKDWPKYTRQAVEFHLKNARAWADAATGRDLAAQVDPDFILGPEPVLTAGATGG